MITKDLLNNSTVKSLIAAASLDTATHTGDTVDLLGVGRKVLVVINAGTPGAGGTLNVVVHESDDNFAANDDVLHTFAEITAAGLAEADLAPNKRYIRVVATVGVAVFPAAVEGVVYLERKIPSGI